MLPLQNQVENLVKLGYTQLAAQAKVAHDVVLFAMHKGGFKSMSTVKGGVVMSNITRDIRRATMDMDIDFVHHSISKRSIEMFVKKLDRAIEGVNIAIAGTITDLKHEDYQGKRIFVTITDESIPRPLRTKLDIGVHTYDEINQCEYSFDVAFTSESAELQVNSNEQIFVEKLLSLLRHGIVSSRPKDIFDMYYLCTQMNNDIVREYIEILIYANEHCKERSKEEIVSSLRHTFSSKRYMSKLGSARANWIGVTPQEATNAIINLLESI